MTVLFKNLRAWGYGEHHFTWNIEPTGEWRPEAETPFVLPVTVLILASGVLGIASYLATQFLPHTRCQLPFAVIITARVSKWIDRSL